MFQRYPLITVVFLFALGLAGGYFLKQRSVSPTPHLQPPLTLFREETPSGASGDFGSLLKKSISPEASQQPQAAEPDSTTQTNKLKKTEPPEPKPLTFAEMNQLYGPCVSVPVLFYHHVQPLERAQAEFNQSLTVDINVFTEQMNYLQAQGYTTITMQQLVDFFSSGAGLPAKPVLLTFDDAYDDFFSDVFPVLNERDMKATVFVPTALVGAAGYLTWGQIEEMRSFGSILFANHTVNHKGMTGSTSDQTEILNADTLLTEHNLNHPKVFAYPYGYSTQNAVNYLKELGYLLAFTTNSGRTLCSKQRYVLPRVRVGGGSLAGYGL